VFTYRIGVLSYHHINNFPSWNSLPRIAGVSRVKDARERKRKKKNFLES